jgi:hypothetical protein
LWQQLKSKDNIAEQAALWEAYVGSGTPNIEQSKAISVSSSFHMQRSMFDVHFFEFVLDKNNLALMGLRGIELGVSFLIYFWE